MTVRGQSSRVTIGLLTYPARARFCAMALERIRAQEFWPVNLVLLNGPELVGYKRNQVAARATGDRTIIFNWDDDDGHVTPDEASGRPGRILRQAAALDEHPDALVCGTSRYYELDARTGIAAEQKSAHGILCGSMAYRREAFDLYGPFDETEETGEANEFRRRAEQAGVVIDLDDPELLVVVSHGGNVTGPHPLQNGSERVTARVRELLGPDLARYRAAAGI